VFSRRCPFPLQKTFYVFLCPNQFLHLVPHLFDHRFGGVNFSAFQQTAVALIEELGRLGIDFVSIRESFDTSSPMGRAMMYIASVFSQLEREIIGHFASIEKCTCYHTKNISLFLFHKKMPIHKTSPCEHSMCAGTRHLF